MFDALLGSLRRLRAPKHAKRAVEFALTAGLDRRRTATITATALMLGLKDDANRIVADARARQLRVDERFFARVLRGVAGRDDEKRRCQAIDVVDWVLCSMAVDKVLPGEAFAAACVDVITSGHDEDAVSETVRATVQPLLDSLAALMPNCNAEVMDCKTI